MNTKSKNQSSKSIPSTKQKKLMMVSGSIILVLAVAFFARGWLRVTVAPKALSVVYANGVQKAADEQVAQLKDPFVALGYTSINKQNATCILSAASKLRTEISCSVRYSAYTLTPSQAESKEALKAKANKLDSLLKEQGWSVGQYSDLNKLFESILYGNGSQPDAYYEKRVGTTTCSFDSNAAFATPKPGAVASGLYCSRTFQLFGAQPVQYIHP